MMQVYLRKEQLSLDVIKQCRVRCPAPKDKQTVLRESIFPNCEKLGQTIIFVDSRANAHGLHRMVSFCLLHLPFDYNCCVLSRSGCQVRL